MRRNKRPALMHAPQAWLPARKKQSLRSLQGLKGLQKAKKDKKDKTRAHAAAPITLRTLRHTLLRPLLQALALRQAPRPK